MIVDAIAQIGKMKYRGKQSSIERLQRTFLSIAKDVRIVIVKFAERIHNLQTLHHLENIEKAERIAHESLEIYAPIAGRLGLYELKELLESEAFRFLHPAEYLSIAGSLAHFSEDQHKFLTSSIDQIENLLGEQYTYEVSYRIKRPYSIHGKMKRYAAKDITEIYDVFAIRIITHSVEDCYAIL